MSEHPRVSMVVIYYRMQREIVRTLHSLSAKYQRDVDPAAYEVIVIDNGSPDPLDAALVESFGPQFRLHRPENAGPSPAAALNLGFRLSRGDLVGFMIDGARILTPGVLHYAQQAARLHENPLVSTLGWHLGPVRQQQAAAHGYNQEVEDKLLESIHWQENGYRLFEISVLAGSSGWGFFQGIAESNCLFLNRQKFEELNGFDERFDTPGGGLVNLDFYVRACEHPDNRPVVLLGEGSFHQIHGGASTTGNVWKEMHAHYQQLRGKSFVRSEVECEYLGHVPKAMLPFLQLSVEQALPVPGKRQIPS